MPNLATPGRIRKGLAFALAVAGAAAPGPAAEPGPAAVEFNRDIRPILSENCLHCHGPDRAKRKAKLRLDVEDGAKADLGDGRRAIVAGNPDESEALARITTDDPDEKMPPPASGRNLTASQVELLRKWIEAGAPWQKHWSLIAPERPSVPTPAGLVRNPIDAFVLDRLAREGLAASPEAPKSTLLRRVTLDLTGLPPTIAEVDAFLADTAPDAYEKAVDRLLASRRYGERMALEWLDAARYADTNGYQGDNTRTMWPWRDWVVRALNANMPFDRFVVEQLAGDLLPGATLDQKVATGFHRNHMLNGEGGRIPEESRVDYVVDRVDTTATVFLGLTLACARCHDHKYDPFAQREYFGLYAYFNSVAESGAVDRGGNAAPVMRVAPPDLARRLAEMRTALAPLEARREAVLPEIDASQADWEKTAAVLPEWVASDPSTFASKTGGTLEKLDDRSLLARPGRKTDVHEVILRSETANLTGLRLEALAHESLPFRGPGHAVENGNFVLSSLEGEVVSIADPSRSKPIAFSAARADYSQPGWDVAGAIDADPKSGWATQGTPTRDAIVAEFTFTEPVGFAGGSELRLRLHYESVHPFHVLGRFRLSTTTGMILPPPVAAALAVAPETRDAGQKALIRDQHRRLSPTFRAIEGELAAARKAIGDPEGSVPEAMVMEDLPTPRDSFVLVRGAYDQHGEKVSPGVPAILPPLAEGAPPNRLGLARWVVAPSNPLTARVAVNRAWQLFFGTGLVKTAEDFGVQGEPPSHPALLDWLATEFVASGWDVKALHRKIVASATYRQASRVSPAQWERDPDNRLLARGPRVRLSSLAIRDQALALGGLLVEKVGGPAVRPYQPPGIWEEMSFGQIRYEQGHGDDLYRRSLYTFWRRTVGPPDLFDTPARQACTVRQVRTNTPLQSLILLNDVAYVEAARNLAQRLIKGGETPDARITLAFSLATARAPSDAERAVLAGALDRLLGQYRRDPEAALRLVSLGESPRDPKLDVPELAAYTAFASLVLNLDETINKE